MEYIYAAMLLHKAGKKIDEKNLSKVLKSAGINADDSRVKALIASLNEVDIDEAIQSAPTMIASQAGPSPGVSEAEAKPEKKEEKEEKKEGEEEALEGLGALFG
ncbi:MAG: 50S ribosomal protein P1 [Candidatus Bathyarchaeota archaeon]|jgi:large subunit ribosomal protein L12